MSIQGKSSVALVLIHPTASPIRPCTFGLHLGLGPLVHGRFCERRQSVSSDAPLLRHQVNAVIRTHATR